MEQREARGARGRSGKCRNTFDEKAKSGSVLAAGVSLAVLASEYPETFRKIREDCRTTSSAERVFSI